MWSHLCISFWQLQKCCSIIWESFQLEVIRKRRIWEPGIETGSKAKVMAGVETFIWGLGRKKGSCGRVNQARIHTSASAGKQMLNCVSQTLRSCASKLPLRDWVGHRNLWKLTTRLWKNSKASWVERPVREQLCLSLGQPICDDSKGFYRYFNETSRENPRCLKAVEGWEIKTGCIVHTSINLPCIACRWYSWGHSGLSLCPQFL